MSHRRPVFFVSDRTGITAEALGHALLNQFADIEFKRSTHPFIDTAAKAEELKNLIDTTAAQSPARPMVFSSIVNDSIRTIIKQSTGLHIDFFDTFIPVLENELSVKSQPLVGKTHGIEDEKKYDARMEAVNFSLRHDDGVSDKDLQIADVILVGVSRSGKTPTCLYLALQYGIRAANYPLTPEDLDSTNLPNMLKPFKHKLYGLTIDPQRLHHIRQERRPNSRYASTENCRFEVNEAESMFRQHNVPFMNTTHKSIEELSASIMQACKLDRRF